MTAHFDVITPVPSPEQKRQLAQRALDRQLRLQRSGEERRLQLLDVAWRLWQEAGAQGFNMRQLAQRAGYTAGALYAYFPGRDTILAALQQRVIDELAEQVRGRKPPRSARSGREAGGGVAGAAQVARAVFIDRSLAWWSWLAGDTRRLQLVLHGGHGSLPELAPEAGASHASLLPRLAEALRPCLDALLATGLPEDMAASLHDEVLGYGMGLLVLQGPGQTGAHAEMAQRFVQSLQRWLDSALSASREEAAPGLDQGDLFPG